MKGGWGLLFRSQNDWKIIRKISSIQCFTYNNISHMKRHTALSRQSLLFLSNKKFTGIY